MPTDIEPIDPADVPALWHWVWPILSKSVLKGGQDQLLVLGRLTTGHYQLWRVRGGAGGFIVTSVGQVRDEDTRACWLLYAAGQVDGGPKERLRTMRKLLGKFEWMAKAAGCAEMRVEAPRWGRVLGYEAIAGDTGGNTVFRKVL